MKTIEKQAEDDQMEDTERQFVENQIVESFNEQKEELMTILSLDHLPDYVIQKDKILEIQFPARGITGTVGRALHGPVD